MWTITGTPHARRRDGAAERLDAVVADGLGVDAHLDAADRRGCRARLDGQVDVAVGEVAAFPVRAASPWAAMLSRIGRRTWRVAANARSPASEYAPAEPASTHVVTPLYQAIGSGSMPQ
jgi:hypothetical protein